jgi:predicted amidohydrolase YtcJ
VFLLAASLLIAAATAADGGLLLEGATVYTSPDAKPQKASVLVRDGKIVFVGDAAKAREQSRGATVRDLSGAFLFAGWSDAHGHLAGLGKALETANLRGAADAAEAARRMAAIARQLPSGRWAEGRGWDQNSWPGAAFPDARDLDAELPERPAAARRVDGHALWANSAAMKAAGIAASTQDPPGGRILRRPNGEPSGVFVDNAMSLLEKAIPAASSADFERQVLAAARACASVGLTQVQDASAYGPEEIAVLARLANEGRLPIRVYATVSPAETSLAGSFAKGPRVGRGRDVLTVRAIKSYADGALGSRGAALLDDYSDEPGNRGLLVTAPERLEELARQAREKGWQLWIHAIGDRGNRVALDAFARARQAVPKAAPGGNRPRIEHAQVLSLSDIPRFSAEGVIASVQPTHATSDMPWAQARVGPERIEGAYAWRRLKKASARMAGGSDFPVESENPLLGFYAAVTRQDLSGNPAGGWRPQDRLTRPEALALLTSDAAYAAFEEDRRGRVAPGFEADLTVFAADPMASDPARIASIPILLTVVGGRVAHEGGRKEGRAP